MERAGAVVMLSRVQFAVTIGFHILWPVLTIGLSVYLVLMEALWLKTGQEAYYRQARFWGRLFLLGFGLGVATGVVMAFQFGTNWAEFSRVSGDFFGNVLGFEATMAFAAEAAFLAVMMFGWHRVPRVVHMFATCVVAFGATLSAFWIMDASAWMQTPAGVVMQDGMLRVTSYVQAVINPNLVVAFFHMWAACLETGLFFVGRHQRLVPAQGARGGVLPEVIPHGARAAGRLRAAAGLPGRRERPVRRRSTSPPSWPRWRAIGSTNPLGHGADWSVVAWPDAAAERDAFAVSVPDALSILTTHSLTGRVAGLKEFAPADRPPILLPYYGFRVMVLIGLVMVGLAAWALVGWRRGWLTPQAVGAHRRLLWAWVLSVPLGFVAVETGWIVREVGPPAVDRLRPAAHRPDGIARADGRARWRRPWRSTSSSTPRCSCSSWRSRARSSRRGRTWTRRCPGRRGCSPRCRAAQAGRC